MYAVTKNDNNVIFLKLSDLIIDCTTNQIAITSTAHVYEYLYWTQAVSITRWDDMYVYMHLHFDITRTFLPH